jgi:hypothetical membrane protein
MSRRAARAALRLYPRAFQRRYGAEMRALLEQTPPRAPAVPDLVRGALMAHVRPPPSTAGWLAPADRVRGSASGVLACWVAFAAAGLGFYKTTEDAPFAAAGHGHRLLGDAHVAIQGLAVVAAAAVVLGALPVIVAALGHARRERRLRPAVIRPMVPVVVFAGLTAILVGVGQAQSPHHATVAGHIAFIVWALAGLVCGAACALACRAVLFAVPLTRVRLLTTLAGGTVVTAAMVAMAVATAVYAIALPIDAAGLSGSGNGPFQTMSTGASLIELSMVMAVAAGLATVTTRRGWRVTPDLDATAAT